MKPGGLGGLKGGEAWSLLGALKEVKPGGLAEWGWVGVVATRGIAY